MTLANYSEHGYKLPEFHKIRGMHIDQINDYHFLKECAPCKQLTKIIMIIKPGILPVVIYEFLMAVRVMIIESW